MTVQNKPEDRTYHIGKQILTESDLKVQITYKDEVFTLKLANPLEKSAIEAEIARRLGALSREAFSADHVAMVEAATYISNCLVVDESPKWYNPWLCHDEMLTATLYSGYLRFRDGFRERLAKDGFSPDSGGSKA